MTAPLVITVDGASGSGKTTLGRRLAAHFDLPLVDTGLVYRGIMVAAVRHGISGEQRAALITLAQQTRLEINTDTNADAEWMVRVDGIDAGALLRDPQHAILLSTISQIPEVRTLLLQTQRTLAKDGAVAVGRDTGTVVWPDAAVKFYLTAPVQIRTERRAEQLRDQGSFDSATVSSDVAGRDRLDAPSSAAAAEAHVLDTGVLDADAVFMRALEICAENGIAAGTARA